MTVRLRHSVRGIVLDERDRILLCRFVARPPDLRVVWVTPGGGVEPGETPMAALERELGEEVGLALRGDPPHVWHQEVVVPDLVDGYDGVRHDYYLVRTSGFDPRGALTDEQLATEGVTGARWWRLDEVAGYDGPDLFSPRDLGRLLPALLADGVPHSPLRLGL